MGTLPSREARLAYPQPVDEFVHSPVESRSRRCRAKARGAGVDIAAMLIAYGSVEGGVWMKKLLILLILVALGVVVAKAVAGKEAY